MTTLCGWCVVSLRQGTSIGSDKLGLIAQLEHLELGCDICHVQQTFNNLGIFISFLKGLATNLEKSLTSVPLIEVTR